MSRIGNKPITVPSGVEVKLEGNLLTVKGPKGTLEKRFHKNMKISYEGNLITVTRPTDDKEDRSLHGLTRTLISNMIEGVTNGYSKELEIHGVGFRAAKQGKQVVLNLGLSHQVVVEENDDVTVEVPAPNKLIIKGIDKQKVGHFAAVVRSKRPPEPYKGKGIRYANEVVKLKEGKAGKGGKS